MKIQHLVRKKTAWAVIPFMLGLSACGQVSGGGNTLYRQAVQRHQTEISLECAKAMTNIQHELQGLAQQFPPFSDIGSAPIEKVSDQNKPPYYYLGYRKNTHEVYETNILLNNPYKDVVDSSGVSFSMYISSDDYSVHIFGKGGEMSMKCPLLRDRNHTRLDLTFFLSLNSSDSSSGIPIRNVIEKQANILKDRLQGIIGSDVAATNPAVQAAQGQFAQAFSPVLTNILNGVKKTATEYPLLSDISSATIENRGTNYMYQHLRYSKNSQDEVTTNAWKTFNALPLEAKGGVTWDVYVLKSDEPFGFVKDIGSSYGYISVSGKEVTLMSVLRFSSAHTSNESDEIRATIKAIDDVIANQATLLREKTETIVGL